MKTGDTVDYWRPDQPPTEQPHAAVVVYIHDPQTVNLAIFTRTGHLHLGENTRVKVIGPNDPRPPAGHYCMSQVDATVPTPEVPPTAPTN